MDDPDPYLPCKSEVAKWDDGGSFRKHLDMQRDPLQSCSLNKIILASRQVKKYLPNLNGYFLNT